MQITSAEYLQSAPRLSGCPKTGLPEIAIIGRSNVGKSSLINFVVDKKGLALTSSKPGKTKSINHFTINDEWYLVDLPGYGFAKISQKMREKWMEYTEEYLRRRETLVTVLLLIDANIPPQKLDIEFANWLGEKGIPFCIVFTKADKSKQTEVSKNIKDFLAKMSEYWEELPPHLITSAEKKRGKEEVLQYIAESLALYSQSKP